MSSQPSRYEQASEAARQLLAEYAEVDIAEMLINAEAELAKLRDKAAPAVDRQTAAVLSGLHRSAEDTVTRVIELTERWHRDGPPTGNQALDELRTALNQPKENQP